MRPGWGLVGPCHRQEGLGPPAALSRAPWQGGDRALAPTVSVAPGAQGLALPNCVM